MVNVYRKSRSAFESLFGRDPLRLRGLARSLRRLEADGSIRIDQDEISIRTRGLEERVLALKHLYSARVADALVRAHGKAYREFRNRYRSADDPGLRTLLAGRIRSDFSSRSYCRTAGAR